MPGIGQLLRIQNMVKSAANAVEANAASARALTESYQRVRQEVLGLVTGSDLEQEFIRLFPEIGVSDAPNMQLAGHLRTQQHADLDAEARHAKALLGQLEGWVQGLIDEQTLGQRLQLEAEARAREEARRVGFGG